MLRCSLGNSSHNKCLLLDNKTEEQTASCTGLCLKSGGVTASLQGKVFTVHQVVSSSSDHQQLLIQIRNPSPSDVIKHRPGKHPQPLPFQLLSNTLADPSPMVGNQATLSQTQAFKKYTASMTSPKPLSWEGQAPVTPARMNSLVPPYPTHQFLSRKGQKSTKLRTNIGTMFLLPYTEEGIGPQ